MQERKLIRIDDTNFIYATNFSGDPDRDKFGSDRRKGNIIIPDYEQAMDMREAGINVKETKPKLGDDEDFVPTYYVSAIVNYDSKWPPRVYLVSGDSEPVLLDEDSIGNLDYCRAKNVNVILNASYNPKTGRVGMYVRTMYVEQDLSDDPYMSRYARRDEMMPF